MVQPSYPETATMNRFRPRQLLKELETPATVAAALATICQRLGCQTVLDRRRVEEELKLQYYYGGRDVACLDTPEGRLVVAVGTPVIEDLSQVLQSLPPGERERLSILSPEPWEERTASVLTVLLHEA